jgi:hypothetical protein
MTKHRTIARICRFGVGAALVASAAMTSGVANANEGVICTASGHGGSRQYAELRVSSRDPTYCIRIKLGGRAGPAIPDCWKAARDAQLPCVNEDDSVNIVDF